MSGKRALTATGPSQSAVAPRQGRRRSVPTEPVADGPFTGPSTATGPFRLVTGPVGTCLGWLGTRFDLAQDSTLG